ncbi:MAG: hypothetical protein CL712_03765 [Chloroflexi bacterium]|nr:hypothetical protein [Chloroflexota bacterium]
MKLFIKIIFLCLFSQSVFAYCDFEIVKMESGMQSLAEKTNFIQDIDNLPELPFTFPIPVEEICKDSKFIMFPVNFTYINKKLYQIFIQDMLSNINHLDNLKYYYGNPTEEYEDSGTSGMNYYHWDLSFKHIFLVIKYSPNEMIQNIEIVSTKYPQKLEKYNEEIEK